jgi:hypothetical protein
VLFLALRRFAAICLLDAMALLFSKLRILGIFNVEGCGEPLGHPIVTPLDLREDVATPHLELRDTPIDGIDIFEPFNEGFSQVLVVLTTGS